MADKRIGELPAAPGVFADTLFAAEQQGQAVKITARQIAGVSSGMTGLGGGFLEIKTPVPAENRADNTLYGLILETYS